LIIYFDFYVSHSIWKRLIEGLQECAEYDPEVKIYLEYKLKEPRAHTITNDAGKAL